jgi:hypothetical protein
VLKVFSFKPADIVKQLNLLRPIYSKTTNYGHFGKNDKDLTWEATDKTDLQSRRHHRKVADLADWGRKEIEIAEQEMPGLMAIREKYGPEKPLKGVRITGSLHMTIQTACSSRRSSISAPTCAGLRATSSPPRTTPPRPSPPRAIPVFAWKGETLEEYWDCTWKAIVIPRGQGPAARRRRRRRRDPAHPQGLRARRTATTGSTLRPAPTRRRSSRICSSASTRRAPASSTSS